MKAEQYVEQAIVQLISLQIKSGQPITEIESLVRRCIKKARETAKSGPRNKGLDIHRLGSVLRTWHRDARYLTFDGMPKPLRAEGRLGLKTLVKQFYPNDAFNVVFDRLLEARLIRSTGGDQWLPSGQTAAIPQLSLETLEHLSEGIARYVETVTRNVTAKSEKEVLFERSAKVTTVPTSELESFRKYVNQQALAFIVAVDDWLEGRSAANKDPRTPRCTAGVYTFAYAVGGGRSPRDDLGG
jgi:hypothetical protein